MKPPGNEGVGRPIIGDASVFLATFANRDGGAADYFSADVTAREIHRSSNDDLCHGALLLDRFSMPQFCGTRPKT